jgi:pimeloyl-ACP methyl ester carboxylesterase
MRIAAALATTAVAATLAAAQPTPGAGLADVGGARIYYEVAGRGPSTPLGAGAPLVLIHGGAADHRLWDGQMPAFTATRTVIRYDLRGAGKSDAEKPGFSNPDDLYGLLKFLKVERAALLGLSRGGGIAADFTLAHPEIVEALIFVSSNLGGIVPDYRKMMVASAEANRDGDTERAIDIWLNDPFQGPSRENPEARARVRRVLADNIPKFVPRFLRASESPAPPPAAAPPRPTPAAQRLGEFRVPGQVFGGDRDSPAAQANYDRTAAGIPGAKRVVVRGAGHLVNIDRPAEFERLVLDFLEGVKP